MHFGQRLSLYVVAHLAVVWGCGGEASLQSPQSDGGGLQSEPGSDDAAFPTDADVCPVDGGLPACAQATWSVATPGSGTACVTKTDLILSGNGGAFADPDVWPLPRGNRRRLRAHGGVRLFRGGGLFVAVESPSSPFPSVSGAISVGYGGGNSISTLYTESDGGIDGGPPASVTATSGAVRLVRTGTMVTVTVQAGSTLWAPKGEPCRRDRSTCALAWMGACSSCRRA